jgi:hypothetical protein
MRTGEYILDHGIPRADPYSFTAPGTKWVAQSWLAELLYGIVRQTFGGFGLRLLGALTGVIIGALLFRIPWRLSKDSVRAGGLALVAIAALLNVWSERPLMLGILAMLLPVMVVELPDSWLGRHPYISLPVLMWLWANVHGTFAIGFGYLALHLIGRALEGAPPSRGRERNLMRAGVLAGVLTLLNPYGIDLVLFPVALMGRGEVLRDVVEWQSPSFRELGGQLFALFLAVTLVIFATKKVGRRDILVTVAFTLFGLWAIRNVGLSVVVILPVLARLVRPEAPRPDTRAPTHRVLLAGAVVALLAITLNAHGQPNFELKAYPVAAYEYIEDHGLAGRRLLTTDAWGGYLIAAAWPEQKVFYDDRYDMYPIDVSVDYGKIANVDKEWTAKLDQYRVEVIMWPKDAGFVVALDERDEWQRVYDDENAAIFVRKNP